MPFGLTAALSRTLLAFTIELDNEFEQRTPHRTADRPGSGGVWPTSMAIWSNFVRLVPPDGWRARNPYRARTLATLADPVATLPRYPMVLHRGGYPDGS